MKKILILVFTIITLYYLGTHFPKGNYKIKDGNVKIELSITDNLMVIRDPECTKTIIITENNKKYKIKYWSEIYEVKIFKRQKGLDVFWVIDDYYRGLSRTNRDVFSDFTCIDCTDGLKIKGKNIIGYEFKNNKWYKTQ